MDGFHEIDWIEANLASRERNWQVGLRLNIDLESLCPGETIMESNNKFCIGTSDGLLIPKTLQRPGGKMLKTEDFFRGFEFPFGCRLNSFPSHPFLKSKLVE